MAVVVYRGDTNEELARYDDGVPEADVLSDVRQTEGPGALLRSTGIRVTSSSSVPAAGNYRFHVKAGTDSGSGAVAVDYPAKFRALLSSTYITKPHEEVLSVVRQRFAANMIACEDPGDALQLYTSVRELPGDSTRRHLLTQHGLHVNGPLFSRLEDGPACLLMAQDSNGRPKVVKLLSPRVDLCSSRQPGGLEAQAVRTLCTPEARDLGIAIMDADVVTLRLQDGHSTTGHPPGTYAAVVMQRYVCSVALDMVSAERLLATQGSRLANAIRYIHGKGLVHMDVKTHNIFIDAAGSWWLGDFGSAVPVGEPIASTTQVLAPLPHLQGTPAMYKYDWHMLGVALAAELHGDRWKEALVEDGHVPFHKLQQAVVAATNPELQALFATILAECA